MVFTYILHNIRIVITYGVLGIFMFQIYTNYFIIMGHKLSEPFQSKEMCMGKNEFDRIAPNYICIKLLLLDNLVRTYLVFNSEKII